MKPSAGALNARTGAADYWVFVNAKTREMEQILRVITTNQGEAAL